MPGLKSLLRPRLRIISALLIGVTSVSTPAYEHLTPAADHHLHIRSLENARVLAMLDAKGESIDESSLTAITAAQVIAALDAAGIEKGLVLSNAYMFGSPELDIPDEYNKVMAENDYVAEQIANYPDRLTGACSVNPMAEYATQEIRRCSGIKQMRALKLHLGNSAVSLLNGGHVKRLQQIFKLADHLNMPVVIHLRSFEDDYGAENAGIFIQQILSEVPELPVQIAHMGGWGGYDAATDAVMGVFAEAIHHQTLSCEKITFDLGAVVFLPEAAGDNEHLAQQVRDANTKLSKRIQQIGPECVVFASDWPSWPPIPDITKGISAYSQMISSLLSLTKQQLVEILAGQHKQYEAHIFRN